MLRAKYRVAVDGQSYFPGRPALSLNRANDPDAYREFIINAQQTESIQVSVSGARVHDVRENRLQEILADSLVTLPVNYKSEITLKSPACQSIGSPQPPK